MKHITRMPVTITHYLNTPDWSKDKGTHMMDSMWRGLIKMAMGCRPTRWRRFIAFPLTSSRQCLPCGTTYHMFQYLFKQLSQQLHGRRFYLTKTKLMPVTPFHFIFDLKSLLVISSVPSILMINDFPFNLKHVGQVQDMSTLWFL